MKYFDAENTTFRGGEPAWANACVGDNGNPQIYEYASGFASAANVLLDEVISRKGFNLHVDVFVYPICFNMRHAVELFLKSFVEYLARLGSLRGEMVSSVEILKLHDLEKIWDWVKRYSGRFDRRYSSLVSALDEHVLDIAKIDPTGQVFRYPFNLDSKKHLVDLALINVIVLKGRFGFLEKNLKELNRLNEKLSDEYGLGTFTAHLSRMQLIEIAKLLPKKSEWALNDFDRVKVEIRKKYDLSSREFSKALSLIQARHEMASIIGLVVGIPEVDFEGLKIFFKHWFEMHDIERIKNPSDPMLVKFDDSEYSFDEMIAWNEKGVRSRDALLKAVSPEFVASVRALYYFHRENPYSEIFLKLLKIYRDEAAFAQKNKELHEDGVMHLLEKVDGLESILNSLNFLGQGKLVESIIFEYGLEEVKARLLKVSENKKSIIGIA